MLRTAIAHTPCIIFVCSLMVLMWVLRGHGTSCVRIAFGSAEPYALAVLFCRGAPT